jgi:Na+-driven multidrug efflux pump
VGKNIRNNLIGDKSFYKNVIAIVLPIIIQNTITNVVSLVDNVMVGRVGMLEMSSVAIVNQLLLVFNLCIFGGLAGAGIFTAQFAGAKDDNGVRYTFRFKLLLSALILAVAFLVFIVFDDPLIKMYVAEDTSREELLKTVSLGKEYLTIMLFGIVPFAVSQVYSGTLRELGETKMPMLSGVIAIFVNLVLNYFLIFGSLSYK